MKQEKGFILIFTVCIITLVSLLVLSSMNNLLLYQRAASKREMMHQDFYQLERIAWRLIELSPRHFESCTYQGEHARMRQLLEQKGCSLKIKGRIYRYLVEDLGLYPCLMIVKEQALHASRHFRFSVLASPTQGHNAALIQLRVIRLAPAQVCSESISYVNQGISSWRYLYGDSLGTKD